MDVKAERIELVGTENLLSSTLILPYNSESIALSEPDLGTINNIFDSLLSLGYPLVEKQNDTGGDQVFTYQTSLMSGQGFDTILFLKDRSTLLGYAYLGRHYGNTYTKRGITYQVDKVNIIIAGNGDSLLKVKDGNQGVNFKMDITNQKPRTENVRKKPKEYRGVGNYGIYLRDFMAGNKKDIITDLGYIKYGTYSGRLNINDITLPEAYLSFNHSQVGFYKGDPSLYLWDDLGQYTILSLTKEIDFSENAKIIKSYTPAISGISMNEIYQIPEGEIKYFAGQYCIVECDEDLYVLDTSRQLTPEKGWLLKGKEETGEFLYYRASAGGWSDPTEEPIKDAVEFDSLDIATGNVVKIPKYEYKYLTEFVIDQSLTARICPIGTYGWKSYEDALKGIGNLSNTELDSKTYVESGYTVIKKVGNWYVFNTPSASTRLWSNMIQTVEFSREEEPIVVNDEVLLNCQDGEYTLYDLPGKFRSKRAGEGEGNLSNKVCSTTFSSPIDIQRSFFGAFRRNILPTDILDFKIIGALGGIIFYKSKNKISYL